MNNSTRRNSIKLWNKNFILLWQGTLVSSFGNVAYSIALGFWILAKTGSTALMGALMAATSLPMIFWGPVAGVWVDRSDRRWILVLTDMIRGIVICVVAIFLFLDMAEIWMVFLAGIVIGTCSAFFTPATSSVLPDLVDMKDIEKANSLFSMIQAASSVIGNTAGGAMFTLLGAPLMFLINGLSYIFSSISELFIKVPKIKKVSNKSFMSDLREGLSFIWNYVGLRLLIIIFSIVNFFGGIVFLLILPLFQRSESLGAVRYGIGMGCLALGAVVGMILVSFYKFSSGNRYKVFALSALSMAASFAVFPMFDNFYIMLFFIFAGGFSNAIMNVLINSVIQQTVPQEKRGKVFGIMDTVTGGLQPVAMAVGGVLGEIFPIKDVISYSLILVFIFTVFICLNSEIKKIFMFDSKRIKEAV